MSPLGFALMGISIYLGYLGIAFWVRSGWKVGSLFLMCSLAMFILALINQHTWAVCRKCKEVRGTVGGGYASIWPAIILGGLLALIPAAVHLFYLWHGSLFLPEQTAIVFWMWIAAPVIPIALVLIALGAGVGWLFNGPLTLGRLVIFGAIFRRRR